MAGKSATARAVPRPSTKITDDKTLATNKALKQSNKIHGNNNSSSVTPKKTSPRLNAELNDISNNTRNKDLKCTKDEANNGVSRHHNEPIEVTGQDSHQTIVKEPASRLIDENCNISLTIESASSTPMEAKSSEISSPKKLQEDISEVNEPSNMQGRPVEETTNAARSDDGAKSPTDSSNVVNPTQAKAKLKSFEEQTTPIASLSTLSSGFSKLFSSDMIVSAASEAGSNILSLTRQLIEDTPQSRRNASAKTSVVPSGAPDGAACTTDGSSDMPDGTAGSPDGAAGSLDSEDKFISGADMSPADDAPDQYNIDEERQPQQTKITGLAPQWQQYFVAVGDWMVRWVCYTVYI